MKMVLNPKSLLALLICAALPIAVSAATQAAQSDADAALYAKAKKACSGPQYPDGARIVINYAGGWFRCQTHEDKR